MSLTTLKVTSNLEKWEGYIEIYNPLPFVKLAVFEDAMKEASSKNSELKTASSQALLLPAILECVAVWKIEGLPEKPTVDDFTVTVGRPRVEVTKLIVFVSQAILDLMQGFDPNESRRTP